MHHAGGHRSSPSLPRMGYTRPFFGWGPISGRKLLFLGFFSSRRESFDDFISLNQVDQLHLLQRLNPCAQQSEMVHYSTLDPGKSEIRLVTLLPSNPRDAIRCTLSIASLDSAPNFTALSYVWGDPSDTKPISVDGEPFAATVNLEACLQAIRKRWRRPVLWIDAICINQKSARDKNSQVPLMGRLYSTAATVLAWLGPSTTDIELFVSWMRTQNRKGYSGASAKWLRLNTMAAFSKKAARNRDWAIARAYDGYCKLRSLPYWERMWTFQEYILPRNEPVCLCGNIQLFQFTTVLSDPWTKVLTDTLCDLADEALTRLDATEMYSESAPPASMASFSVNLESIPELRANRNYSLRHLLISTVDRKCGDRRDKVFALYGMMPAVQYLYPADYTRPVNEVMHQAAAYIVNFEQGSKLLWHQFGLYDERLSDASPYPSWMPDFTKSVQSSASKTGKGVNLHVPLMRGVAPPLTRPDGNPALISVGNVHPLLRIWARYLGTCEVALRFGDTAAVVLQQMNGLLGDVLDGNFSNTMRKPETLLPRIGRACVAHYFERSEFSPKEIVRTMIEAADYEPSVTVLTNKSCFEQLVLAAEGLTGKELIVTKDGCFGISVGGVKDGDIIIIPPDVETPLVLTRDPTASVGGVQYWKMVGTAIIDGIMHPREGEMFDEELVDKIARRYETEFAIH